MCSINLPAILKASFELREAIGYLAGSLGTVAFLPQLVKTIKHKSTGDISLGMYVLFCIGVALWLIYGLLISSWPVVVANLVTLALCGTMLVLKIKHG